MKVMQRLIILLSLLLLTAGCVTLTQRARLAAVSPPIRRLGHPFTIRAGERLLLEDEGLTVEFTQVLEDSRCPAKAACVVRGNAKIAILLRHGDGAAQHIELDTDPVLERTRNTTEDGEYQLELAALDQLPDPSDKPVLTQRYIATLTVTKVNLAINDIAAQLAVPFTLKPGQWAKLANTSPRLDIQFHAILKDQRCLPTATCGVTAEAQLQIGLRRSGMDIPKLLELRLGGLHSQNKIRYADLEIELKDLMPKRASDQPIAPDAYSATLVVNKVRALPTATPTTTQVPTATPTPTIQATPIRTTDKTLVAPLHAPFTLNVGQAAQIIDEDFSLTFRSAAGNSGCFTEDDCSVMEFDGTLAAQKGDQKELMTIMASFHDDAPFTTDFAGYTIILSSSKKLQDGSFIATFVVVNSSEIQPTEPAATPMPTMASTPIARDFEASCPFLSQADGIAILGEPVTNAWDGPVTLCGYGGVAQAFADTHDILALGSTSGVAAGVLSDEATHQLLLQLVETLHQANPDTEEDTYPQIKTLLTAGMNEDVITQLGHLVEGAPGWTEGGVSDLGKFGVWLSRINGTGENITLLLAPRIDTGTVFLLAQTNGERNKLTPSDAMMTAASKLTR